MQFHRRTAETNKQIYFGRAILLRLSLTLNFFRMNSIFCFPVHVFIHLSPLQDYDMDIYLMMAWRDARLVNPYNKPILVKEEEILEKIWRPDPFFANAKEAEFHEVTFLNFLMRIFPDGLVLYETR